MQHYVSSGSTDHATRKRPGAADDAQTIGTYPKWGEATLDAAWKYVMISIAIDLRRITDSLNRAKGSGIP